MADIFGRRDVFGSHRKIVDINFGMISKVMGVLVLVEAGLLLISAGVSLLYHESDYIYLIYTAGLNVIVGLIMLLLGRGADKQISRRDGYFIVSVSWLIFTFFGMLPFYLSGAIPSVTDACFETMSGFTTTGASILDDIESLSHGLLFWRSLTQWIGGLGIVLFTIAVLPLFGGSTQQLFLSEATGVTHDKIQLKTSGTVRRLWIIYIILTFLEALFLMLGGMDLFDAVCQSFTTTATGGFSTKQSGISYWDSPYIEYVVSIFMILSGINFSLYYFVFKGRIKNFFKDDELRWFLKSLGTITIIITIALFINNHYDLEKAFRKALFQVASLYTSCGFATDDYNLWPPFTWMLLVFGMISGGCTGSTSGGIKDLRILIIFQNIKNQFRQMIHPRAILPVRVNKTTITPQVSAVIFTFFATYLISIFIGDLN